MFVERETEILVKMGLKPRDRNAPAKRQSMVSTERRGTVCPGNSDSFYIVSYYITWVTTSWTHSI